MGPQMDALFANRNLPQVLAAVAVETSRPLWEAR